MVGITHISFATMIFFSFHLSIMAVDPKLALWIIIGALLPDIDKRNSTLGKYLFVHRFLTHRKQTHSLVVTLALMGGVLCFYIEHWFVVLTVFIGILSHILLDLFNLHGVYLFWPIWNKRISFRNKFLFGQRIERRWKELYYRIPFIIRKRFYRKKEKLIDSSLLILFTSVTVWLIFKSSLILINHF